MRSRPFWATAAAAVVGARFPIIAESFSAALRIERGQRVLDIGAGSGHVAVSAGRRGCQVASVVSPDATPYMRALRERDMEMIASERLAVDFWRWDLAGVPFPDADFDVVASSFAATFEPNQEEMAGEMLRLCRPGGRVGVTSWTPDSFIGRLFQTIGAQLCFPGDISSPFLWGTEERVHELFGMEAESIDAQSRALTLRYSSLPQCLGIWKTMYEPLRQALESADAQTRSRLIRDVEALIDRCNRADDGSVMLRVDYLEVVVRKRDDSRREYSH